MKIRGAWQTHQVFVDGEEIYPQASLILRNHSPSGFAWGYGGSGPAQLALAILLTKYPANEALEMYQDFKWSVIAGLPQGDFDVEFNLEEWVRKFRAWEAAERAKRFPADSCATIEREGGKP